MTFVPCQSYFSYFSAIRSLEQSLSHTQPQSQNAPINGTRGVPSPECPQEHTQKDETPRWRHKYPARKLKTMLEKILPTKQDLANPTQLGLTSLTLTSIQEYIWLQPANVEIGSATPVGTVPKGHWPRGRSGSKPRFLCSKPANVLACPDLSGGRLDQKAD